MKDYDPKEIEKKWQEEWEKSGIYKAEEDSKKPKYYTLVEFPYPSGDGLHVGHVRSYTAIDALSRKRRMQGHNVLYPIGWDAFGLPTENYAIKTGKDPRIVTKENTDNFRRQLKSLGLSFDWSREINTTDPKYYKWTQWIFLKFFEKGLAYKAKSEINWCPKDKIGLANEEVVNGCCERCGTPVEKREKEQWMLAITKYADRLDKDLDEVDYPERVKTQQRNWIGRSEGAEIDFEVKDSEEKIKVFTTRPDTIFGATYMVLAPEHELVRRLESQITNREEVQKYIQEARKKTDIERSAEGKEKTGVELKGVRAINPANKEEIPVFIADYVLPHYGTGAIMAVPAHDKRDFEFAEKYNLPIKRVVEPKFYGTEGDGAVRPGLPFIKREAICAIVRNPKDDTYLCNVWKGIEMRGLLTGGIDEGEDKIEAALREIKEETGYKNVRFISDPEWSINTFFYHRQKKENRWARFHFLYFEIEDEERESVSEEELAKHEFVWKKKEDLNDFFTVYEGDFLVTLLNNPSFVHTGEGIMANSGVFDGFTAEEAREKITEEFGKKVVTYKLRDWVFSRQRYWGEPIPVVHCSKCGVVPVPEKDLPVLLPEVENYQPTETGESPLANISEWVNTTCPKCGGEAKRETDVMPQWAGSSWYYLRYTDPRNDKEFASKENMEYWMPVDWYNGGMEHTTLHLLYSRFWHKFLFDLGLVPGSEPYKKRTSHGLILAEGGEKMSKSRGNVVNPDEIVGRFGADTLRLYEMFMGPFEQAIAWSEDSLVGPRRFLEKVWRMRGKISEGIEEPSLMHGTIKKVTEDIEVLGFNTAVSALMILSNDLDKKEKVSRKEYEALLLLLAPFAPHITEELWRELGHNTSIHMEKWPEYDEKKLEQKEAVIIVQVNGRKRGEFGSSIDISEEEAFERAESLPEVKGWLEGKEVKRRIYVRGKIVNIVV
jgi:leucyl-tRNA synthetase